MSIRVLKFGGSSISDSNRLQEALDVSQKRLSSGGVVVFSAMGGVTDLLIAAAQEAAAGNSPHDQVEKIRSRHIKVIYDLCPARNQSIVLTELQLLLTELEEVLHGVSLVKEFSPRTLDLIMSFGERLATTVTYKLLIDMGMNASLLDARKLILTDAQHGSASVKFNETVNLIQNEIEPSSQIAYVVPGFLAATVDGVITTLGRNGSDYTAALIAAAIGAKELEIWTDVDGVMSADPRQVDEAFVISQLSYQEAMEMCYFGARVIHPYTIVPVVEKSIPITIKNTSKPQLEGSQITCKASSTKYSITSVASVNSIALINVEGGGMLGARGIAAKVLGCLAQAQINIMMISQASSEHSICVVLEDEEAEKALGILRSQLELEIKSKRIDTLDMRNHLAIVAIIGEHMRGTPGIAGKLFAALGCNNINILAIAQGSSERNISLVVDAADEQRSLRVIHKAFLES